MQLIHKLEFHSGLALAFDNRQHWPRDLRLVAAAREQVECTFNVYSGMYGGDTFEVFDIDTKRTFRFRLVGPTTSQLCDPSFHVYRDEYLEAIP